MAMPDRRGPLLKTIDLVKLYHEAKNKEDLDIDDFADRDQKSRGTIVNDRPLETNEQSFDQENENKDKMLQEKSNDLSGNMAVKGVSFNVRQGEIFALLGLNGAGKSSIFNMLVGQESISGGRIIIDDLPISEVYRKPHYLDHIVGYCRQGNDLESGLTVLDYLTLIC